MVRMIETETKLNLKRNQLTQNAYSLDRAKVLLYKFMKAEIYCYN